METQTQQQAKNLIEKSQRVLLVTRTHPSDDSIGSLLALGLFFEKLGKEIDLVCHGPLASSLEFLPKHGEISREITTTGHFVISLDTSAAKVAQFSYDFDHDGNRLNIFITPEQGRYEAKHVSTNIAPPVYDLVVVVDGKNLESLGPSYENNKRVFFETPIINIDSSLENERFGEVNYLAEKATSTTEVVFSLIEFFGENYFDSNIATCLLAGVISKTRSFQNEYVTPETFSLAADLISEGADQQKIIQNMFKNKSLPMLKLWGRALSRVSYDLEHKIMATRLFKDDFAKTETSEHDLLGLEEELLATVGEAEFIVLAYENENKVKAYLKIRQKSGLENLARHLLGKLEGERVLLEREGQEINAFVVNVTQKIKEFLKSGNINLA